MLLWIQDAQTSLLGLKKKNNISFQHMPVFFFSFVKNTKLQLYEGIMQNLNENYLIIIKFNTTHTQTHYIFQTKRYVEDSMFN